MIARSQKRTSLKNAGFKWHSSKAKKISPASKAGLNQGWWTDNPLSALNLLQYADESCRDYLELWQDKRHALHTLSMAEDSSMFIPVPDGLDYHGYQKAGIAFSTMARNTLIADEMGLGKTIQAIGVINMDRPASVLVVCPASLKINWQRELVRWLCEDYSIGIANGDDLPDTQIVIINYDIIERHTESLCNRGFGLMIADECHAIKNINAKRSKAAYRIADTVNRKVFLTGTPILNRPMDIFPILKCIDPVVWSDQFRFGLRYCDGQRKQWGKTPKQSSWDFKGASNLDELQRELRSNCMVRRLKSDVLSQLPPKVRQLVEIPADSSQLSLIGNQWSEYKAWNNAKKALAKLRQSNGTDLRFKESVANLQAEVNAHFSQLAKLRLEAAKAKLDSSIEMIREALSDSRKIIVFAHHREIIESLTSAFGTAAVKLYGGMSADDKQASVDRFQNDPECKVFVGSILAAGVGLTLTASSHVVFVEFDWRDAMMMQAEDRAHRMGQNDSVLCQYFVLDGSIDAYMMKTILSKKGIAAQALDHNQLLVTTG